MRQHEGHRRDKCAAGERDPHARQHQRGRSPIHELVDPRLGHRERAHRDQKAERNVIGIGEHLVQRRGECPDATDGPHRVLIRRDLLLHGVVLDQLFDHRDDVQPGGEIAGDDQPERVAVPQVIALVEQHRAQLVGLQAVHQTGGEADARSEEPIAERERPLIPHQVHPATDLELGCERGDGRSGGDPP